MGRAMFALEKGVLASRRVCCCRAGRAAAPVAAEGQVRDPVRVSDLRVEVPPQDAIEQRGSGLDARVEAQPASGQAVDTGGMLLVGDRERTGVRWQRGRVCVREGRVCVRDGVVALEKGVFALPDAVDDGVRELAKVGGVERGVGERCGAPVWRAA